MNISQLEYFVTTVQCGSISMAAKELFVSPQAVSKAVNDLERELHISLYEKTGRGIKPTPFGVVFSTRASEILSCLVDLEALAKSHTQIQGKEGSASLAIARSACRGNAVRPDDMTGFEKSYPFVHLDRSYHTSGSCLAALEEGVVDAAIIIGRTTKPGVSCVRLFSFVPQLMMARDHPLAGKRDIALENLRGIPLAKPEDLRYCHALVTNHLRAKGVEPNYVAVAPHIKDHRAFLEEHGVMLVVGDPALEGMYPNAITRSIAHEDLMPIPMCFAYATESENPVLPLIEHYLVGMSARIRRTRRWTPDRI